MTTLISDIAKKASNKLNEKASQSGSKDNINQFITNVYFEVNTLCFYILAVFKKHVFFRFRQPIAVHMLRMLLNY